MRSASVAVGFLALVAAGHVARADADGLTDALGPRELALGGGLRAGAFGTFGASATSLNPAGLAAGNREVVFEGSYGYRAADSASLVSLSACDSTNAAPGCFYYRYSSLTPSVDGMELDHQTSHVGGVTVSRVISNRFVVGTGLKYFNIKQDMAEEADSGVNWDLGGLARLTDTISLGVVGYNIKGSTSSHFPRAVGAGVTFQPSRLLAAAFDAVWDLDTDDATGRYGGGIEYYVSTRQGQLDYPLRAGALHDVAKGTFVSGGLGLATPKFGLDVSLRQQVADGDELQVSASLRVFGPRL
jgi:hypothetical protein